MGKLTKVWESVVLAVLSALVLPGVVNAATHHVRAGAAGLNNGTNWDDAYRTLPATLVRGDIYYIADGSYGAYDFNDPVSGSLDIRIVKATPNDHGVSGGWLDSYGDGEAVFSQWNFYTGHYHVDGRTGGGPSSWGTGHGFALVLATNAKHNFVRVLANDITDVTIEHTRMSYEYNRTRPYRDDVTKTGAIVAGQHAVYNGGFDGMVAWTFRYCYFERPGQTHFLTRGFRHSNWVLEHSLLEKSGHGDPGDHSELWSHYPALKSAAGNSVTNVAIRYNYILDWVSTGGFMFAGSNNIQVYGNVFRWSQDHGATGLHGFVGNWTAPYANTTWEVHNNTIINVGTTGESSGIATRGANTGIAYNNVWYSSVPSAKIAFGSAFSHDYSAFINTSGASITEANKMVEASDPFVSVAGGNFKLKAPMPGLKLGGAFGTDAAGQFRGGDGTWDRGAFEFVEGVSAPPKNPTNLRAK